MAPLTGSLRATDNESETSRGKIPAKKQGMLPSFSSLRPNKEHHDSLEFPFFHLALAICAENDRNGGYGPLNGREKVPVPVDKGN